MKLAVCYTVWNGLEFLGPSVAQIYDSVDFVVICWQKQSNKGEINPDIETTISRFKAKKYKIVEFKPDLSKNTKQNERDKHNLMLETARKLEASHILFSATDHFYRKDEFETAKKSVEDGDFDVSFTKNVHLL